MVEIYQIFATKKSKATTSWQKMYETYTNGDIVFKHFIKRFKKRMFISIA